MNLLRERGHCQVKFGGQDINVVRTVEKKSMSGAYIFLNTIHGFLQNNHGDYINLSYQSLVLLCLSPQPPQPSHPDLSFLVLDIGDKPL